MANKKKTGLLFILVGLIALVLSLIYDYIGGSIGYGTYQITAIILSVVIILMGFWLKFKK